MHKVWSDHKEIINPSDLQREAVGAGDEVGEEEPAGGHVAHHVPHGQTVGVPAPLPPLYGEVENYKLKKICIYMKLERSLLIFMV